MSKIMVMAKLRLNDENLLEDWKVISAQIDKDLVGVDGFISRDVVQADDGLIYCILKWESRTQQEKFMEELMVRTDEESMAIMVEFARVVNVEEISKEFLTIV